MPPERRPRKPPNPLGELLDRLVDALAVEAARHAHAAAQGRPLPRGRRWTALQQGKGENKPREGRGHRPPRD
jgi:hypothetical protein